MNIDRSELICALRDYCSEANGIVVGSPGVGKTFSLKTIARENISQQKVALVLQLDRLVAETSSELSEELGIEKDLVQYLDEQIPEGDKGLVIFDGFDSARSERRQKFLLSTLRRTIRSLKGKVTVIVGVRTYDAMHSEMLLELFPSESSDSSSPYTNTEIPCRNFAIPELTDAELSSAISNTVGISKVYQQLPGSLKDLLRLPFNIWLLENILQSGEQDEQVGLVKTQIQLLSLYWKKRVFTGQLRHDKQVFISRVTHFMVEGMTLSSRVDDAYLPGMSEALEELLSAGVLEIVDRNYRRIAYSHNILFDFAVSILLIEDSSDSFAKFIIHEPGRTLFLRPSLLYFLTRLWHDKRETFWAIYDSLFLMNTVHTRLVTRLLIPTVLIQEIQGLGELSRVIEKVSASDPSSITAARHIIQALRVLKGQSHTIWVDFIAAISNPPHPAFAWESGLVISQFYEEAKKSDDMHLLAACAAVARKLLSWALAERVSTYKWDSLGAIWLVPIVSQTYQLSPDESRELLTSVLRLLQCDPVPIDYIYRLTSELGSIIKADGELVAQIYQEVVQHKEMSTEETHLGGYVLPLMSNRRQDYEMCQYNLKRFYGLYLEQHLKNAIISGLSIINSQVLFQHVYAYMDSRDDKAIERRYARFNFRGREIILISDHSFLWDSGRFYNEFHEEIAEKLFATIAKIAMEGNREALELVLDTFSNHANVTFLWRRLLQLAAEYPYAFCDSLFPLCLSMTFQTNPDLVTSLGRFLEKALELFDNEQRLEIERSILRITTSVQNDDGSNDYLNSVQRRLICRFDPEQLQTPEGLALRNQPQLRQSEVRNEPLVSYTESIGSYSDHDWLRDRGADLESPASKQILNISEPLADFIRNWSNDNPTIESIRTIIPLAVRVRDALDTEPELDEQVAQTVQTRLAEVAEKSTSCLPSLEEDEIRLITTLLIEASKSPYPLPSKEDTTTASWSPAPRIEAAQGLPIIAARYFEEPVRQAIIDLSGDSVNIVRYLVASDLHRVSRVDSEFYWSTIEAMVMGETSPLVVRAIIRSLYRTIKLDIKKGVELLSFIERKFGVSSEELSIASEMAPLALWLALERENEWAYDLLSRMMADPLTYCLPLAKIIQELVVNYLPPEKLSDLSNGLIKSRQECLIQVVKSILDAVSAFLRSHPEDNWDKTIQEEFHKLFRLIDEVINRISFAIEKPGPEARPIPRDMLIAYYPLVRPILQSIVDFGREGGIILAPSAHRLMEALTHFLSVDPSGVIRMASEVVIAAEQARYSWDPMAVKDVVNLVEKAIVDFKGAIREPEVLDSMLTMLDIFAEKGWPDSLRLIWRLDDAFR